MTDYPTAASQVQTGVDGIIVPMDVQEWADCLAEFIMDTESRDRIALYLREHDYGNENEIEKIYKMASV